jgi:hypothetical protein
LAFESLESRTLLSADPIGVSVLLLPAPAEVQIVFSANFDHAAVGDDHGTSLPAFQLDLEVSKRTEQDRGAAGLVVTASPPTEKTQAPGPAISDAVVLDVDLGFPQPLSFADTATRPPDIPSSDA